ncbi:signal transduction histidine kinase, hybrid-type, ethylene sensor [Tasmannia lanceolata]|uniref:signal transduction histidine kinase, hybrid-type, ethylene sensor n=1 Tax=Tasmannia lanceolata TaxID=3420 RepID=UPI004062C75F
MLRVLGHGLLVSSLLLSVSAAESSFSHCNCDVEGIWSIESILKYQKVSDLLIALAYFSIPVELGYFVSCSNLPFKWVLGQFIAFIVLCGLTHLFTAWIYEPHSFHLMLALTIFKFLTALVSCATSITLVTMIPLLLRVKVRELFLKRKTRELGREVGMMKKQEEASWHVRMLTQEIRKSLDKHTILYTTLVELSKTLALQNCAVWMPNADRTEMILTHELKQRNSLNDDNISIPISDPDVQEIKGSKGVKILRQDSILTSASSGDAEPGAVAGIRMPMLRVSNFKGGTPELVQACYAVLVLVLPNVESRVWSSQELEIVEVVADQVAVALSHAAVLEESQLMRDKLVEQNRALQQARKNAMMASQARNSFQKVMSQGMRRPMHSISGLLSMIQQENLDPKQKVLVDTMVKTSSVISTLINDVMEISTMDNGRLGLEMRSFELHSMIKETASLAKCLCVSRGFGFEIEVDKAIPNWVIGDEKRIFQVILHMVGNLLNGCDGGLITFRVLLEIGNEVGQDHRWLPWRQNSSDGRAAYVRIEIVSNSSHTEDSISSVQLTRRSVGDRIEEDLSFSMCRKLVQMMQGNIWVVPNSQGLAESMTLVLRFQSPTSILEPGGSSSDHFPSNSLFRGLKVLVADDDDVNRAVTRKLLERLGCHVSSVSSGFECLRTLGLAENSFQVVLLDLQMPEMDGFEVAVRIQKYRSGNWPLIVALTASANEDVWEKCLQIGMNGVIRKPVLLQGIGAELRRVLQQAS